ncbi:hypothetical protein MN086_03360 [Sulfurovum sp. XGS-02]|uniref:hypothetical protein n=1 Tax=Sulfurovum sp. XGS-02 TaxID=2925411 RepID=UPI00205F6459|nr:hypothetical protein [Sulfurovum sp. XGS-02]UPT78190.1 hypothetical protein MN086_03360 [Sulfurovum sp. XGS-02]
MGNEEILTIEDDKNQKLFYRFTPAALISNFVPLIVILDEKATHFEHKMWNVLTPLDHFGSENKALLQKLIEQIAEEYECEDHIYLYGSGMGGYDALLQGILCRANAVYADAPRIRLEETKGTNTPAKENDLTNFLNGTDAFPVFYLCKNENVLEDETAYFADACKEYDINVHLDFCPKSEDETQIIKEVLGFFEKMASEG